VLPGECHSPGNTRPESCDHGGQETTTREGRAVTGLGKIGWTALVGCILGAGTLLGAGAYVLLDQDEPTPAVASPAPTTSAPSTVEVDIPSTSPAPTEHPFAEFQQRIIEVDERITGCSPMTSNDGCVDELNDLAVLAGELRTFAVADYTEVSMTADRIIESGNDFSDGRCFEGYTPNVDVSDEGLVLDATACTTAASGMTLGWLSLTMQMDTACMEAGVPVEECDILGQP
jgi:hypothetical protein